MELIYQSWVCLPGSSWCSLAAPDRNDKRLVSDRFTGDNQFDSLRLSWLLSIATFFEPQRRQGAKGIYRGENKDAEEFPLREMRALPSVRLRHLEETIQRRSPTGTQGIATYQPPATLTFELLNP
jgi:hypothetical protein